MAEGLRGAFLLARGQAAGLLQVGATPEAAARSFWAAAICLPAFLALRLQGWAITGAPPAGLAVGLAAELIAYAFAWAAYALATLMVADASQRRGRWPLFVAAWNYTNVVQYLALLAAAMLPLALGLPAWVGQALTLAAVGYALWLEWFVARTALGLAPLSAAGLVVMDFGISIFVTGLAERLSGRL